MFHNKLNFLGRILATLMAAFVVNPHMADYRGTFDSVGGNYDEQTGFAYEKMLFYQMRNRTVVGSLSRAGRKKTEEMISFKGGSLDGSAAIARKRISKGDMFRYSQQEHAKGLPTYGDENVERGDFLGYRNLEARVNMIKSPAIPVQGEMSQQRAAYSLRDIPGHVRQETIEYMAEQMEYEFLEACAYGASPSVLQTTANGGLGIALGISGTAGTPLMPMNMYTYDQGWITYSTTPATWNTNINTYVGTVTATADEITLVQMEKIRDQLDTLHFRSWNYLGLHRKAIALCDPQICWRIRDMLKATYKDAMPRGKDNPTFNCDYIIDHLGILWIPVPNLKKFRPAAGTSYPSLGCGSYANVDPRNHSTTSSVGWIYLLGANAMVEGYNGEVQVRTERGYMGDGLEYSSRTKLGYVRAEWFAKDGRTDSTSYYSDSFAAAMFYEPGIGTDYA